MADDAITRSYSGSDTFMLEKSEELQIQFLLDVADFTAYDEELDVDFGNDWLAAIDAAVNFESDDLVLSQQEGKTATVLSGMQACSESYMDIIYFAEKAFKNDRAKLREFGQGAKYRKATKSQPRMVEFMKELFDVATKYSAQLTAKGCPPLTIAAIETVGNAYRDSNNTQNLYIDNRPVLSQERVILLNAAHAPMAQVVSAAERVYRNDFAKRTFYSYDPPSGSNNNDVVIEITLNGNAIVNIDMSELEGKTFELATFEAEHSDIKVFGWAEPGGGPNPIFLLVPQDDEVEKTQEELTTELGIGEATPFINAQNTGAAAAHLKITFSGVADEV
jgi:hypothetical protein